MKMARSNRVHGKDVVAYNPTDGSEVLKTQKMHTWGWNTMPRRMECPVVHTVWGMSTRLPFLAGRWPAPIICMSDWQYEQPTQEYFWAQVLDELVSICGGARTLERTLMLVAGDMASNDDRARGASSDAAPNLQPFKACQGEMGEFRFVYGNHDNEIPAELMPTNANGTPTQLPDGMPSESGWVTGLRIGGVHGIPGVPDGFKKRNRKQYYSGLRRVCESANIVVTHHNPALPFQTHLLDEGEPRSDAREIFKIFNEGEAQLLVNGHSQTSEVVTVLPNGKVVVNCDHRVVVLMPFAIEDPEVQAPSQPVVDVGTLEKEVKKLQKTLREISKLEERRQNGEGLERNQLMKCDRKEETIQKLQNLEASLAALQSSQQKEDEGEILDSWEDALESSHCKENEVENCNSWEDHLPQVCEQAGATLDVMKLRGDFANKSEQVGNDFAITSQPCHSVVDITNTKDPERKLRKKLREIDDMKEKEQQGECLRKNRKEKMEKRESIEALLLAVSQSKETADAVVQKTSEVQPKQKPGRRRWNRFDA